MRGHAYIHQDQIGISWRARFNRLFPLAAATTSNSKPGKGDQVADIAFVLH